MSDGGAIVGFILGAVTAAACLSYRWKPGRPRAQRPAPAGPELSEDKINLAMARADEPTTWRGILQLIATAESNANSNAADDMHDPTVMAGYVGGAEHLRMLREDLKERRRKGIEMLGAVRS